MHLHGALRVRRLSAGPFRERVGLISCCRLPWWALIVGIVIAVFVLPFYGAMSAITGCVFRGSRRARVRVLRAPQVRRARELFVPDTRLGARPWVVAGEHGVLIVSPS